ncbi:MAG: TetR/AcrR family transcriptional regulator [Acidobacteriota bacterium]
MGADFNPAVVEESIPFLASHGKPAPLRSDGLWSGVALPLFGTGAPASLETFRWRQLEGGWFSRPIGSSANDFSMERGVMENTTLPGGAIQRRSAERRQGIIRSVIRTFSEHGFRGSTTKLLAQDAGISEALLYRYFASKKELFDAVLDDLVERANPILPKAGAFETSKDGDRLFLIELASKVWAHFQESPEELRLLLFAGLQGHSLSYDYFQRQVRNYYESIILRVRSGQRSGYYRGVPAPVAARVFIGMLHYHVMIQSLFKDPVLSERDSDWMETFVSIFLDGIQK